MTEKKKAITVGIVHYNTPELTEACIKSIRKHGGEQFRIVVLDNSDRFHFKRRMKGVKVINNTKGQVIDFDRELEKYPDREPKYAMKSNFGSFKHTLSVQKLWELLPDGFILVESDTLIRGDLSELWREEYACVGRIQWHQPGNKLDIPRWLPFLLYMNVPLLQKYGARFFDPQRCWALQKGEMTRGNWYDTGASLREDIHQTKPWLVGRNLGDKLDKYYVHYQGGSWRNDDLRHQAEWLKQNEALWNENTLTKPINTDMKQAKKEDIEDIEREISQKRKRPVKTAVNPSREYGG